jgi:hypothetical protein
VLPPPHARSPAVAVSSSARGAVRASLAKDGEDELIDWDKEAAALVGRQDDNRFVKAIKSISAPALVQEFAQTAPKDVQLAVKSTIGNLLGNLPPQVMESSVTSPGRNLGSLMFSMQMTGYMFRNAEYRQSLVKSLSGSSDDEDAPRLRALPPIAGKISVKIGEGMEAEVDAAAYMAELRAEVAGLRSELVSVKQQQQEANGGVLAYMQSLTPEEAQGLTSKVSRDVRPRASNRNPHTSCLQQESAPHAAQAMSHAL